MVGEEISKVASTAVESMKSSPLAIALLIVNIGFLVFSTYVLGEVAANSAERNKEQINLISTLVRDCRVGPPT
jgi:predicted Na+-dependent transporter